MTQNIWLCRRKDNRGLWRMELGRATTEVGNFTTMQLFPCPGKFKFFITAFFVTLFYSFFPFWRNESWQSTTRHIQRQFDLPYKEIWCGGEMFQIILIFRRWSSISLREDSISISTLQCLWSLLGTWKKKVRNITQYLGKIKKCNEYTSFLKLQFVYLDLDEISIY